MAAATLFVGGCAAGGSTGQRHPDVMGMACPKCEAMWIRRPTVGARAKSHTLHWGRETVCPDCDRTAQYFKDGAKVLHNCRTCKVTPRPAKPYTPTHPKGTHI